MTAIDNITQLGDRKPRKRDVTQARSMLDRCAEILTEGLANALPRVMDGVDDALFDLADKSVNNEQQAIYFEAMRELRLKRAELEETFARELGKAIEAKLDPERNGPGSTALLELSHVQLGLVDTDEMECTIAVTNMVTKIRRLCHEQLFALEHRVAVLLGEPALEGERNPFGPEVICDGIREACDGTEATIEVRLIVLKLFDRQVASPLGPIYEEINHYLMRRGVLPDAAAGASAANRRAGTSVRQGAASSAEHAAPGEGSGPDASGAAPAAASDLERLLHVLGRAAPVESLESPDADLLAQSQVLDNLTRLQHGDTGGVQGTRPALELEQIVSGTANIVRQLQGAHVTEGVSKMDALVTDVVALMFDYIFDDEQIPDAMKALIGRLQIPILKVAIMDKSLFGRKQHPTKQLLDRLATAAVGRADQASGDHAFYERIEQLVLRVLDEFDDGLAIFETVLVELDAFLAEDAHSVVRRAARTTKLIEGRERLAAAKREAEALFTERLRTGTPAAIRGFLDSHWREHLITTFIKEGGESEAYRGAVGTMDDLLWSVEPKVEAEDRRRLVSMLPDLVERLKAAMTRNAMPERDCQAFLVDLQKTHLVAMRASAADSEASAEPEESRAAARAANETPAQSQAPEDAASASAEDEEVRLVRTAIEKANAEIHATAEKHAQCRGMGTTVVVARFRDDRITVGHVGDSRLYRLRGGRLAQITRDHSLRQHLMDEHSFSAQEAEEKVSSNIVTRAVGVDSMIEATVARIYVLPSDLFLMCSDGLTDMVDDERIGELLIEHGEDLDEVARALLDEANARGGRDNISIALVRVLEPFPAPDPMRDDPGIDGRLEMAGLCDVGRQRAHNEDSLGYSARRGHLTLADGMGGCNAGEVASGTAVNVIMESLKRDGVVESETDAREPVMPEAETPPACEVNFAALNAIFWEGMDPADEPATPTDVAAEGSAAEYFDAVFDSLLDEDDEAAPEEGGDDSTALYEAERTRCLEFVDELELGTWVAFEHTHEPTTRARLTWVSPATGRYLFTDRRGLKVADASREGLALEFRLGNATIIDKVPLFDRAISNVTARLRAAGGP